MGASEKKNNNNRPKAQQDVEEDRDYQKNSIAAVDGS
jgi:hypothetical protein